MHLRTVHTTLSASKLVRARAAWRKAWFILLAGVVCSFASINVSAKPMTESAIQSRTIRSDAQGVVLQTRSGDSLREIARYYSVRNNIPFQRALDLLTQTNQAQFPAGDPNRMQVGAHITLPSPTATGSASVTPQAPANTTSAATSEPTVAIAPSSTTVTTVSPALVTANPQPAEASTQTPAPPPTATEPAVAPAPQDAVAKLKSWLARVPQSLWLIVVPALLLALIVGLLTRRTSRQNQESDALELKETDHSASAPVSGTVTQSTERESEPTYLETEHSTVKTEQFVEQRISDESIHSWLNTGESTHPVATEPQKPLAETPQTQAPVTPVAPVTVQPATVPSAPVEAPASHTTHETVTTSNQTQHSVVAAIDDDVRADQPIDVKPEAAEEIETRFKQALHGLTAEKLDLRTTSVSKAQLTQVMPSNTPVPIAPTVPAAVVAPLATAQTLTASSDSAAGLNVNHLLRQYANHTAEKSGQAVNYYALAERTRLQKWMSAQSIDDLLDHAQKAYAQAYPNVAHHILNEVILRGNAAQSTQALDLRNQWHIQYLRQQAQESRGH